MLYGLWISLSLKFSVKAVVAVVICFVCVFISVLKASATFLCQVESSNVLNVGIRCHMLQFMGKIHFYLCHRMLAVAQS